MIRAALEGRTTMATAPDELAMIATEAEPNTTQQRRVASPSQADLAKSNRDSRSLFYDSIAPQFDRIMNAYDLRRRLEVVFDELLGGIDLTGRALLDAGCGTGPFSVEACRRGAVVTSLDVGPRLLAEVRRKCDARTVEGDVTALQFADASFDIVISSECIEHTPDPRRAVAELLRVCRPGGLVVVTCPNRTWHWSCVLANRLGLRPYDGYENWPTWWQLRRWIGDGGGRVARMTGVHLLPFVFGPGNRALRPLDRLGAWLGPLYVNQAVLAERTPTDGATAACIRQSSDA